jgi:hypothetical protein
MKCPWAKNGGDRHPFGYVLSLGLAGGINVNPNNGTASAEFFEGISVAIQRVSLLFGIHNGRYQTFADGYYVGEALPGTPGQTTARTERILDEPFRDWDRVSSTTAVTKGTRWTVRRCLDPKLKATR